MLGKRTDERDLGWIEGVLVPRERAESSEHLVTRQQWGDDHRGDAQVLDDAIGAGRMPELRVVHVVRGHHGRPFRDRKAEHPYAGRKLEPADPVTRACALDAGI